MRRSSPASRSKILLVLATLAASCSAVRRDEEASRAGSASTQRATGAGPTLELVQTELAPWTSVRNEYLRFVDVLRLTNPTAATYRFMGLDRTPAYSQHVLKDGSFERRSRFMCANGLEVHELAPGESIEFRVPSTRGTLDPRSGRNSYVELMLFEAASEDWTAARSEPYFPALTADAESRAREMYASWYRR